MKLEKGNSFQDSMGWGRPCLECGEIIKSDEPLIPSLKDSNGLFAAFHLSCIPKGKWPKDGKLVDAADAKHEDW